MVITKMGVKLESTGSRMHKNEIIRHISTQLPI